MRALACIRVLTILCIGTTVSYAQTTVPVDPLDSMPIRLGPIGLNPTLAMTNFGIDDNIFNDATDPKRDFTMTVTPRLQARLRGGKMLLSGTVATGLVYYQKFDDERSIDYTAQGRVDIDSRVVSALRAGVAARHPGAAQRRAGCARAADARRPSPPARVSLLSPKTGFVFDVRTDRAGRSPKARPSMACSLSQSLNSTHQDHRGRPGAVPDAADDVRRHGVTADRSLRPVSGAGRRHVQNPADDSDGGARHHPGLARGRLPPLLRARPRDPRLQRTRGKRVADAHVRRADEGGSHARRATCNTRSSRPSRTI